MLKSDKTWGAEEGFWRTWGCPAPPDTSSGDVPAQYLQKDFTLILDFGDQVRVNFVASLLKGRERKTDSLLYASDLFILP